MKAGDRVVVTLGCGVGRRTGWVTERPSGGRVRVRLDGERDEYDYKLATVHMVRGAL